MCDMKRKAVKDRTAEIVIVYSLSFSFLAGMILGVL